MFNSHVFNRFVYNRQAGVAYRFHPILEAEYYQDTPQVNRSFVVGVDPAGGNVTANALTSDEAALVGERLDVRHDTAVTTATAAGYAAAAVLARYRLDARRARITVPPHCGLELWDVVSIVDIPANQATSYRVTGYSLEIDIKAGHYTQVVHICNL